MSEDSDRVYRMFGRYVISTGGDLDAAKRRFADEMESAAREVGWSISRDECVQFAHQTREWWDLLGFLDHLTAVLGPDQTVDEYLDEVDDLETSL